MALASIAALSLLSASCNNDGPEPEGTTTINHTVVAYVVAENSLSSYLIHDLQEMVAGRASIPQDAQLLIFMDDDSEPRLYRLTASSDTVRLHTWKADICATDSASMCDVLDVVKQHSPSCDRFDLIMSSHASGWIPQVNRFKSRTRSFGIDNNRNSGSNTGIEMEVSTLRDILRTKLGHVGYIFFDACYMQCIEVAHEMREVVDYIVASPTEIPGTGADYTNMMPCFFAADAPVRIVEQYYADEVAKSSPYSGVVVSAVSTAQTPALALATQPIVSQLCQGRTTPLTVGVQTYGTYDHRTLYRPTYYDMLGLALLTDDEAALTSFSQQLDRTVVAYRATKTWLTSFPSIFRASIDDITRTCGVSMFLPEVHYDQQDWNNLYHDTQWYTAAGYDKTGW